MCAHKCVKNRSENSKCSQSVLGHKVTFSHGAFLENTTMIKKVHQ